MDLAVDSPSERLGSCACRREPVESASLRVARPERMSQESQVSALGLGRGAPAMTGDDMALGETPGTVRRHDPEFISSAGRSARGLMTRRPWMFRWNPEPGVSLDEGSRLEAHEVRPSQQQTSSWVKPDVSAGPGAGARLCCTYETAAVQ